MPEEDLNLSGQTRLQTHWAGLIDRDTTMALETRDRIIRAQGNRPVSET
jgi:hypothetical protein